MHVYALADALSGASPARGQNMQTGVDMKDVKVDVRVNVDVDAASIVVLVASAAVALFWLRQQKQEKLK